MVTLTYSGVCNGTALAAQWGKLMIPIIRQQLLPLLIHSLIQFGTKEG
jgi:hypothetical protein